MKVRQARGIEPGSNQPHGVPSRRPCGVRNYVSGWPSALSLTSTFLLLTFCGVTGHRPQLMLHPQVLKETRVVLAEIIGQRHGSPEICYSNQPTKTDTTRVSIQTTEDRNRRL